MVQAKQTVIVLGTLGTGKSTLLNRLGGQEAFEAKKSMKGVTQEPKKIEFPNFYLIDTPGLNDTRIPMADWACRYNETTEMSAQETIHLALIIFKCKERPDLADFNIMGALKEALDHICPQNVALVFTFADQDNEFDQALGWQWYNEGLLDGIENDYPSIPQDRIFLFRGKDGQGGRMTTSQEIENFVTTMLPPPGRELRRKEFKYEEHLSRQLHANNEQMQRAAALEIDLLKSILQDNQKMMQMVTTMMQNMSDQMTQQQKAEKAARRCERVAEMAMKAQKKEPHSTGFFADAGRAVQGMANRVKGWLGF